MGRRQLGGEGARPMGKGGPVSLEEMAERILNDDAGTENMVKHLGGANIIDTDRGLLDSSIPWAKPAGLPGGKHDDSLMDAVHASTFATKIMGARLSEQCLAVQRVFRSKIKQAQRFILDDDAVRLICHLSHEVDRIEHWALLARIPYDPIWFEFNSHVKVQEFEKMGSLRFKFNPDEVLERMGFLMWRDTTSEDRIPRWVCHVFGRTKGSSEVISDFIAYVYDPEGDNKFPVRGSQFWSKPTLSLRPGFPKMPVRANYGEDEVSMLCDAELMAAGLMSPIGGGVDAEIVGEHKYRVDGSAIEGPKWLMPRIAVIVDPWWDAHLVDRQRESPAKFNAIIQTSVGENRGTLRWIVAMLASINGLPRDIVHHHARQGRRSIGMNMLPFFTSSTISVTIPRENRLIHARKILDKETHNVRHRKRHGVMGHWRIVERSKIPRGVFCSHIPALVEGDLAVCEKCGLLVRYIHDHERGDEKLGYVRHTYKVET